MTPALTSALPGLRRNRSTRGSAPSAVRAAVAWLRSRLTKSAALTENPLFQVLFVCVALETVAAAPSEMLFLMVCCCPELSVPPRPKLVPLLYAVQL